MSVCVWGGGGGGAGAIQHLFNYQLFFSNLVTLTTSPKLSFFNLVVKIQNELVNVTFFEL